MVAIHVVICLCLLLSGCQTRRPNSFLIPPGYVGWVRVSYGIAGAPALSLENGRYLVKFPADGHLVTSTPFVEGTAVDKYYYNSPAGRQSLLDTEVGQGCMIWSDHAEITSAGSQNVLQSGSNPSAARLFFVGTRKQFDTFDDFNRIGPLRPDRQLTGKALRYKNLRHKSWSGTRLEGADLSHVSAEGIVLQRANLKWATIHRANLDRSDLRGACLQYADLLGSILQNVDLRSANLRNARLEAVDFRGARLSGADVNGSIYDSNTRWPEGFDPQKHGAVLGRAHPDTSP